MTGVRRLAPRDDCGSIAPAIPIIALFLFLLAGLVIDSSRLLNARGRAVAYAEEAARAGGQQIDLNSDAVRLDPDEAARAVADYCAVAAAGDGHLATCRATTVSATQVTVDTAFVIPTGLLGIVGVHQLTARGEGEATSQQGITGVDTYPSVPPPSRVVTEVPLPFDTGTPNPSATFVPLPTCTPTPSPTPSATSESPTPTDPSATTTDDATPTPSTSSTPTPTTPASPASPTCVSLPGVPSAPSVASVPEPT